MKIFALWLGMLAGVVVGAARADVMQIDLQGPICPASSAYVNKAIERADAVGAAAIVLRIDTPGGLDGAMREIVQRILASPVPVIGYVAPGGARAASAGTYILYATHIAAMAPATNLGAATPVRLGGIGAPASDEAKRKAALAEVQTSADAETRKTVEDAVAYLRALAVQRGRNADWAEQAVRRGASLPASEAVQDKVVDLLADNVPALLQAVDGREVTTVAGTRRLQTANAHVVVIEPGWRDRLLAVISSPTIAYLLLLAGVYGLLLEGLHPGATVPGVVGGICLLLGLFAMQVLPVNYAGLALMALGLMLFIAETLVPSFGALGFGGIVAFVGGSIMLMDTDVPGYGINLGLIVGLALGAVLTMVLTLYFVWRARRAPIVTGRAEFIGSSVQVLSFDESRHAGWARFRGERWRIVSMQKLAPGETVRIADQQGLTLVVEPFASSHPV